MHINVSSYQQTQDLANRISQHILHPIDCIIAMGTLGVGKTQFFRDLIRILMKDQGMEILSPTFNLVNYYTNQYTTIHHYDLYRIENPDELLNIGLEESLSTVITLIEWPKIALEILPKDYLSIIIDLDGTKRHATLSGEGRWKKQLTTM